MSTNRDWFHSKNIALLQCLIVISTTITSWAIALKEGHVKLWPIPMISHCGVYAPEKYVFSIGLVCAAFLMFLFIWIVETADKIYSSRFTAWALGFPCSIGLMVLAVCNCEEEPTLHYIGAIAYFVGFALWCLCCSFKEIGLEQAQVDKWVRIRKILSVLIALFTFTMLYLFLIAKEKVSKGRIPVCEWAAVICAELYVGTFYFDLGNEYYIEQVRVSATEKRAYKKLKELEEEA